MILAEPQALGRDHQPSMVVTGGILLALLVVAGALRFHQLDRQSLWIDEYSTLYLATGRGDALFNLPMGVVLDPPPNTGFAHAPPWWHIWYGIDTQTHPPLYHIVLRWWVDWFGDSDRSTHALSATLSLAAVALMFEALRPYGRWRALIGAALMAFAPAQIYFAHETRPYALLMVLGLLTARSALSIARLGPSAPRVAALGGAAVLFALTHYLSAGALVATGLFAAIALRGARRRAMISTLLAALAVVVVLWGPQFWRTQQLIQMLGTDMHYRVVSDGGLGKTLSLLVSAPLRLTLLAEPDGAAHPERWALAALVFAAPLWAFRRRPETLFWWLWAMGSLLFVAMFDIPRHAAMLDSIRYIFVASPAVFALLALPLPLRHRQWVGYLPCLLVLLATVGAGVERYAQGEPRQLDWRTMAQQMQRAIGPHELIVFTRGPETSPAFYVEIFDHYAHDPSNPIVMLDQLPRESLRRQLAQRRRIWVLAFAKTPLAQWFPGWHIGQPVGGWIDEPVWPLTPPGGH